MSTKGTEVAEIRITSHLLKTLLTEGLRAKYPDDKTAEVVGVIQHKSGAVTLTVQRKEK